MKIVVFIATMVLGGCIVAPVEPVDPCDNSDDALTNKGFVIVSTPTSGTRVEPGFEVRGCSVTFEANVPWVLYDDEGDVLADGFTMGGNLGIPGPFSFTVDYTVSERQFGKFVVFEEDPSGGEGKPPIDNIMPLILEE